jgi:hypothetical protein
MITHIIICTAKRSTRLRMNPDGERSDNKLTQVIQVFLAREFPDFIVQQRQERSRKLHVTLTRVEDRLTYRIAVARHFLDSHTWPIEIETFLEHHDLVRKIMACGGRTIIVDNIGVHFGKG